jgi:hypothetical protein
MHGGGSVLGTGGLVVRCGGYLGVGDCGTGGGAE